MGKSVVFLAQSKFSVPIEDQRSKCVAPGDEVILAGDIRFGDFVKATVRNNKRLRAGDRLKLYDLNSLILAPGSLIRILIKLLRAGVTIEICSENLEILPVMDDRVFRMLVLLDNQQRAVHAVRTHGPDMKTGRKAVLKDEQWPAIRDKLSDRRNSTAALAAEHGVGRTTLFNFVRRMKAADHSLEKAVE